MSDNWQKLNDRGRSLRDWAADTRALAEKMKTQGAQKGMLELAAYFNGKADEVDALMIQMKDQPPERSALASSGWHFSIRWLVGRDARVFSEVTKSGFPEKAAVRFASFCARILASRNGFSSSRA